MRNELTQHNGIPVLLGHPGHDNLASLINDAIYVSLLQYIESETKILMARYSKYVSLVFLSANVIHRQ